MDNTTGFEHFPASAARAPPFQPSRGYASFDSPQFSALRRLQEEQARARQIALERRVGTGTGTGTGAPSSSSALSALSSRSASFFGGGAPADARPLEDAPPFVPAALRDADGSAEVTMAPFYATSWGGGGGSKSAPPSPFQPPAGTTATTTTTTQAFTATAGVLHHGSRTDDRASTLIALRQQAFRSEHAIGGHDWDGRGWFHSPRQNFEQTFEQNFAAACPPPPWLGTPAPTAGSNVDQHGMSTISIGGAGGIQSPPFSPSRSAHSLVASLVASPMTPPRARGGGGGGGSAAGSPLQISPPPGTTLRSMHITSPLSDHSPGMPGAQNSLYKTELCRSWEETGACRYGVKCQFAHGRDELRPVLRHPKYKTEVCRTFAQNGTCPYGTRCRFIHYRVPQKSILGTLIAGAHSVIPADWSPEGKPSDRPTPSAGVNGGSPGQGERRLPIFQRISDENAKEEKDAAEAAGAKRHGWDALREGCDDDDDNVEVDVFRRSVEDMYDARARRAPMPFDISGSALFGNVR